MLTSSPVLDSAWIRQTLVFNEVTCGLGSGFKFLHPFMPFQHPPPAARVLSLECTPLVFSWAFRVPIALMFQEKHLESSCGDLVQAQLQLPVQALSSSPAAPLSLLGPSTGGPLCPEPTLLAWETAIHLQGLTGISLPQEAFS